MDGYAYVLDHLRRDEFRRLRAYTPSSRSQFSTWLVVVVHRLGLDHHRHRYGYKPSIAGRRPANSPPDFRRRLVDLVADPLESTTPLASEDGDPEAHVRDREFQAALESALDELPARDRLLLKLRFERELSARKIAGILDFPTPFHVYRRCNQVCQDLRSKLAGRGVHDPLP